MSESSIPNEPRGLEISGRLVIPLSEIEISFTRSSGPGGQHVNKTSTRAEISFNLAQSPSISEVDRTWLLERLRSRLDTEGALHIAAQEYRSQLRNKTAALERLEEILKQALKRPKKRKKTKPSKAAKEKRLESKRKASEKKKERRVKY